MRPKLHRDAEGDPMCARGWAVLREDGIWQGFTFGSFGTAVPVAIEPPSPGALRHPLGVGTEWSAEWVEVEVDFKPEPDARGQMDLTLISAPDGSDIFGMIGDRACLMLCVDIKLARGMSARKITCTLNRLH